MTPGRVHRLRRRAGCRPPRPASARPATRPDRSAPWRSAAAQATPSSATRGAPASTRTSAPTCATIPASEHLAAGGPALLDVAHWATERPWLDEVAGLAARRVRRRGHGVRPGHRSLDRPCGRSPSRRRRPCREGRPGSPAPSARPAGRRHRPRPARAPAQVAARARPRSTTVARELSALEDERVRAQVAVDDLDRDISRFEKDIEQVRIRKDRDKKRLDAGGALREIEGLQHELATLNRRQSELEDAELELMEQREAAEQTLDRGAAAGSPRPPSGAPRPSAGATRRTPRSPRRRSSRRPPGARSPPTCRPTWSPCTTRSGWTPGSARRWSGRAAAAAAASSCTAPTWPGSRRPPADEVVRCEECRRIMVRTAESGPVTDLRVLVEADGGSRGNPGPAGLRRGRPRAPDRRDPARAVRVARRHHQQRRRVHRTDRGAQGGARAERHRGRRTDGLQAGRRADVRPLADQEPGSAPARGRRRRRWCTGSPRSPSTGFPGSATRPPTRWPTGRWTRPPGCTGATPRSRRPRSRSPNRRPGRRHLRRRPGRGRRRHWRTRPGSSWCGTARPR